MDSTDKDRIYKEGVAADPVELDGDAEYTDLDAKQIADYTIVISSVQRY